MTKHLEAMAWIEAFELGNPSIDETHREFIQMVNALLNANAENLDACLAAFVDHARDHFGEEDRLMAQSGYTNARCHIDEHRAVLASVEEVRGLPDDRRFIVGQRLAQELARWFPGHLDVMDRGLVDWLVRHRTGGAPLKFMRQKPEASAGQVDSTLCV
ncbi:bacteriohemerythrin [Paraburkholderia silvatlantica]|uniref:bacteriohemerythrin n=1 Tax=Paraburkholderia silvatlantica TaxID=321895 RepID=UPI0037510730